MSVFSGGRDLKCGHHTCDCSIIWRYSIKVDQIYRLKSKESLHNWSAVREEHDYAPAEGRQGS